MSDRAEPLPLFAAHGIELEYMIVDRDEHNVLPATDQVLKAAAGEFVSEIEEGPIGWSNELVLHVIELKTNGPADSLEPLPGLFLSEISRINRILEGLNGRLMPTAMHPWMDPMRETRLWPHGHNEIYATYDRIFDCRGHGWSNLQSMHVNLPFADDAEFGRLHAAVRTLMPVMPAIAASSPLMQWQLTGFMDTRLETYRHNAKLIPIIAAQVIPEWASSRSEYEMLILEPMFAAIAPHDPEGILQYEWLNSRGAIARFDRNTIEIRVLDTQECPAADIAVAATISAVLKTLSDESLSDLKRQGEMSTDALAAIFLATVREADDAVIRDRDYLALFAYPERRCQARELWQHLTESLPMAAGGAVWRRHLSFILREGCLARRIARAVGNAARRSRVRETYRVLCDCLAGGSVFEGID